MVTILHLLIASSLLDDSLAANWIRRHEVTVTASGLAQTSVRSPEKKNYCDDYGCWSEDKEGTFCKQLNPKAKRISCPDQGSSVARLAGGGKPSGTESYCDDAGCMDADTQGARCKMLHPQAQQIDCSTMPVALDFHIDGIEPPHLYEQAYCDSEGCKTADADGIPCKFKNPTAVRVPCGIDIPPGGHFTGKLRKAYCDDAGCWDIDPTGSFCRKQNPDAKEVSCREDLSSQWSDASAAWNGDDATRVYCDDFGCWSPDPTGAYCKDLNPAARQVSCLQTTTAPEPASTRGPQQPFIQALLGTKTNTSSTTAPPATSTTRTTSTSTRGPPQPFIQALLGTKTNSSSTTAPPATSTTSTTLTQKTSTRTTSLTTSTTTSATTSTTSSTTTATTNKPCKMRRHLLNLSAIPNIPETVLNMSEDIVDNITREVTAGHINVSEGISEALAKVHNITAVLTPLAPPSSLPNTSTANIPAVSTSTANISAGINATPVKQPASSATLAPLANKTAQPHVNISQSTVAPTTPEQLDNLTAQPHMNISHSTAAPITSEPPANKTAQPHVNISQSTVAPTTPEQLVNLTAQPHANISQNTAASTTSEPLGNLTSQPGDDNFQNTVSPTTSPPPTSHSPSSSAISAANSTVNPWKIPAHFQANVEWQVAEQELAAATSDAEPVLPRVAPATRVMEAEPRLKYHNLSTGGSLSRSGFSPHRGIRPLTEPSWTWMIPEVASTGASAPVADTFYGSPVLDSEENVYIQSSFGWIYSLTKEGQLRWSFQLTSQNPENLALLDGIAYTCSQDGTAWAIDMAIGHERWHRKIAEQCSAYDVPSLAAAAGAVLIPCNPTSEVKSPGTTAVCAISTQDGSDLWTYDMQPHGSRGYNQVLSIVGDAVYFGDINGGAYSVSLADGKELWHSAGVENAKVAASPSLLIVGPTGAAYIGFNLGGFEAVVRKLDLKTGVLVWSRRFHEGMNALPAVGPLDADGKTAIVVAVGHNLERSSSPFTLVPEASVEALDAETGMNLWSFHAPQTRMQAADCCSTTWGQPLISADGTVYVNWAGGKLFALRDGDKDGGIDAEDHRELSFFEHNVGSSSQPAIGPALTVSVSCGQVMGFHETQKVAQRKERPETEKGSQAKEEPQRAKQGKESLFSAFHGMATTLAKQK